LKQKNHNSFASQYIQKLISLLPDSKMKIDKTVISFFGLFLLVYFLESIGGFFMTSAIVSIEKQFQIPSKVSGLMVSASDFGYIPSVVFVAYLGGKGNY
jgi:hypothetical protein